jgi:seryl-tRNA synthetase
MPLKKNAKSSQDVVVVSASDDDKLNMASSSSLEDFLDRRLKQQSEHINDLFMKYSTMTKKDLDAVKSSQSFLSSKFDDLIKSVEEVKDESKALRVENVRLQECIASLEGQVKTAETDMENLKQYLQRDIIEIHGVPASADEDTNSIVRHVVELVDSEINLDDRDISISHRLPASPGHIPAIIVKLTHRNVRNKIFNLKHNLRFKNARDLGFQQDSKLYINESLAQKCRELLKTVKSFKRENHFKFVWSRMGKVFLRKDENQSSRVWAFTTLEEVERFKVDYQHH